MDTAIGDVSVPQGLLESLRQIPMADDDGLDAALRDVPVPMSLVSTWRRRAERRDRFARLSRMAVAASIVLVLTLSYFSIMIVSLAINRTPSQLAAKPNDGDASSGRGRPTDQFVGGRCLAALARSGTVGIGSGS